MRLKYRILRYISKLKSLESRNYECFTDFAKNTYPYSTIFQG